MSPNAEATLSCRKVSKCVQANVCQNIHVISVIVVRDKT